MIISFEFRKLLRSCLLSAFLLCAFMGLSSSSEAQESSPQVGLDVTAAIPQSWPPQYSLDNEGQPTGFAIDVMNAVAKRADIRIHYVVKPDIRLAFEAAVSGEVDVLPNTGITPDRQLDFDFTAPIETFPVSIFVREGTPNIFGQADLAGRKVAVIKGNVAARLLKPNKKINLEIYTDARSALFDLIAGRIDAFVYPEPVLLALAREAGVGARIKIVGKPLKEIKRAIAVRKGETELFKRLSRAVTAFVDTPEYRQIYVKWYGAADPFWTLFRLSMLFSAVTLLAVLLVVAWRFWSLRQVNRDLNQSLLNAKIASRAKAEFMANMSHELRTPLNAIIGFSETIKGEVFGPVGNDRYLDYLGDIHESGQHLLGIINDILDVSAIEAGKLELQEGDMVVADLVESSVRLVTDRASQKRIRLSTEIQSGLPIFHADTRRIKQVLLNLLSNAVKFTLDGGAVTLSVTQANGGGHVFSITDTGIGMNNAELTKAMAQFSQVDSGLTRKEGGTGLGLPLTKGLVELHGGTFNIASEKGVGTTATVTFPKARVV